MRRRTFIAGLGGAAAMPFSARAQQAMPMIALFNSGRPTAQVKNVEQFRQGLKAAGLIEGQNVAVDFRWAENQFDRLPALAAAVIARRPAVIVSNTLAALAAKSATTTIPIVFTTGSDPIRDGLVASLSRPGGNATGIVFLSGILGSKRLELLRQLVPKATKFGMILYPDTPETEFERKDVHAAAQSLGQPVNMVEVRSPSDIEGAFATLISDATDALLVGTGPFTFNNRGLLVALASRHAIPAMYANRDSVEAGGLTSYAGSLPDAYHQVPVYIARILKGEKPADLPVMQSTKFEFVINLNTAKALGLEFHPQLLATADEVIE
jgi:putative ABC transport system substrate-binding protein